MAILKCKMCGGSLDVATGTTVIECEYCGTQQTLPKTSDEVTSNLFNRANNLRLKCEFDKAAQIYEKIVEKDDSEAEAHWGIVLCKYGIEYVEDPKTLKRIPTCHRTLFEAVTTDPDYLAAIDYSDALQQRIYESEARTIDRIQKDILAIVKNEKPFDVFICYKETDENGKRTVDSTIANDIYYQLTQQGFKVFFAAITLEDKLGQEYEPYIFAALNSSKVMLAIATKPEYFSSVWVKNEWSRFLHLMKSDRSKLLIPCYRDMDAYDMPEEFAHLQAQDMGKIGFINDVVRGIKKVVQKEEEKQSTAVKEPSGAASSKGSTTSLLERAFMFLEDGEWASANEYCEKVLDIEPKNAQAYLGKLMAELRVKKQDVLRKQAEPFDNNNNYQKAIRFADENLKNTLTGYIEHINTRNENARLDGIYTRAKNAMSAANTESAYKEAAQLFESVSEYQDSAALAQSCYEKAEVARKDAILAGGKAKMTGEVISNYETAIKLFESISGWKDANEKVYACQKKIEEIKVKAESDRLEKERLAELTRKEAEKRAKRNKKIAIITTPIVCAIIAFIIVLNTVIIPTQKKNDFIATYGQEVYDKFGLVVEGEYIKFGAYEQDNNTSNGKEDVEWLVLEVKDGKALLISKYALDCKQYNTRYTDVTWETCTLRKWLNNDFLGAAFSADEKAMIPTVTVSADKNPDYSTNPGNATQDQVFLLSITEVNKYFSSDSARQCKSTDYAVANGAYVNSSNGNCWWWLRSPGYTQDYAAHVYSDGYVSGHGGGVSSDIDAVRPALWIDLNS